MEKKQKKGTDAGKKGKLAEMHLDEKRDVERVEGHRNLRCQIAAIDGSDRNFSVRVRFASFYNSPLLYSIQLSFLLVYSVLLLQITAAYYVQAAAQALDLMNMVCDDLEIDQGEYFGLAFIHSGKVLFIRLFQIYKHKVMH